MRHGRGLRTKDTGVNGPSPWPAGESAGSSHRRAGGSSTFLLKINYFLGLATSAQDTASPQRAQRTETETAATGEAGGTRPQPQGGTGPPLLYRSITGLPSPHCLWGKCEWNLKNRRSWGNCPCSGTSKPPRQTWGSVSCCPAGCLSPLGRQKPLAESPKEGRWRVIRKPQGRTSTGRGCIEDTLPGTVSST